jgi:cytochrome c peroxidase
MVRRFRTVYNERPSADNIADAIASYERALLTLNSPFDRYQAGDATALTIDQLAGYSHFKSLGCSSCHQGVGFGGNMYQRFGVMTDYFALRGRPPTEADRGRFNVTGRPGDLYMFKVPSLRNVALTAPYFHDGSAASLESAVGTMAQAQLGIPVTGEQLTQLVAFLNALTGEVEEGLR